MTREEKINEEIKAEGIDTNKISDGYHTFKELYDHRITLFIALCKTITDKQNFLLENGEILPAHLLVWRSKKHSDGELAFGGEWFVLGIGSEPGKQITYHLPISDWDKTSFAKDFEKAPEWDGHTPADVIERFSNL